MKKHKARFELTKEEARDLRSVLKDFFKYMEELKLGENTSRSKLAKELIQDLEVWERYSEHKEITNG